MGDGQPVPGSLYIYAPNKGAPIFFVIAFAVSGVGHVWQSYHYKCFKLMWLHPFCAVLFTVGYALRAYGAFGNYLYGTEGQIDDMNLSTYIVSQIFVYICPPILELANYHVLGRVFYYVPYLPPLPPGRVLSIFGLLMAVVESINAVGVFFTANPSSSHVQQETGQNLIIAALAMQLTVIFIFIILASVFHRRCHKADLLVRKVFVPLMTLYVSMSLILTRCIYRLVEHAGHATVQYDDPKSLKTLSPLLRYEWFFYLFEGTLMLVNSVLWNVWNPGRSLPKNYRIYLAQDGTTEVEAQGKPDDRSLPVRVISVLTFGFLYRRKEDWVEDPVAIAETQGQTAPRV